MDLKLKIFKSHLRLNLIEIGIDKIIKKVAKECNNYVENTNSNSKHISSFQEEVFVLFTHMGKHTWCSEDFWNMVEKRNTKVITIIQDWIQYLHKQLHSTHRQLTESDLHTTLYKNFVTRLYLDSGLICPNPKITQCSSHIGGTQILNCFIQSIEDTIYSLFPTTTPTSENTEIRNNDEKQKSHVEQYQDFKNSGSHYNIEQTTENEPKYNSSYKLNEHSNPNGMEPSNPYDVEPPNPYDFQDTNSDVDRAKLSGINLKTNDKPRQTGTVIKLTHSKRLSEKKKKQKKKSKRRKDKYDPLSLDDSSDDDYYSK